MTDYFDIENFIEKYIKNIRTMQHFTDTQIREIMLIKIKENTEYFEIISNVSQKVDNKKTINKKLKNSQITHGTTSDTHIQNPSEFKGRKIA